MSLPDGAARAADDADPEAGSGLFGLAFGIMFFLGFMLLATQVALALYARSVVTGAALDAGRILATSSAGDGRFEPAELAGARRAAAMRVQDLLGDEATLQVIAVDLEADVAEVEVRAPKPRLLLGGGTLGDDVVARRVTVRVEELQ